MKAVATTLLVLALAHAPVFAEKIPVEGWYKSTGSEFGEKWKDSGRRTHFFSVKDTAEVTIYGENFGFKGKAESDWALSIFDKYVNGTIVSRSVWTSEKDSLSGFKGHKRCELTGGSTTCVMWFKGFGEFKGKILELNFNEKDAVETDEKDGPNLYILEGSFMDEPTDE
jgi:hypothetical protein